MASLLLKNSIPHTAIYVKVREKIANEVHSHSGCMPWTFDGYVRSVFAQFFNSAWELLNRSLFIFLFVYTSLLSDVVLPDSTSVLII